MPKPGELPLRIMPGVGAADRGGLFEGNLAGKMTDQRRHAMRLHRRQQRIKFSQCKRRDFIERNARDVKYLDI